MEVNGVGATDQSRIERTAVSSQMKELMKELMNEVMMKSRAYLGCENTSEVVNESCAVWQWFGSALVNNVDKIRRDDFSSSFLLIAGRGNVRGSSNARIFEWRRSSRVRTSVSTGWR